jgi:hypothetical protein
MADCGFEKDLSNGMKMGLLGLALGALAWLGFGAIKSGRSYSSSKQPYIPPPSQFPPRDHHRSRR